MSDFSVRRFRPADREAVVDLHRTVPTETPGHVPDAPEPDLRNVEDYYLSAGGEFLVGLRDGRVVATAAYGPVSEWRHEHVDGSLSDAMEVRRLRVDPNHRRGGVGRRLYEYLEDSARTDNVAQFVADVGVENEPGRRFFEACGFGLRAEVTVEVEGNPLLLALYRTALRN